MLWIYDGVTQGEAAEVTIAWVFVPEASGDGGKMRMLGLPECSRTRLGAGRVLAGCFSFSFYNVFRSLPALNNER